MGRSKLTSDAQVELLEAIELGASYRTASSAVGICYPTLARWLRRGAAGEEPYREFVVALRAAEVSRLETWQRRVDARGPGWKSAAWLLERLVARSSRSVLAFANDLR